MTISQKLLIENIPIILFKKKEPIALKKSNLLKEIPYIK